MRTHVDLTSGIGGFALAARWNDVRTVGFCEIDPWCRRVLAKNFPGVACHDDVKTLASATVADWTNGQRPWILTAGYPCQPFSVAGQRRGAADSRHLWPFIAALVADVRPTWCLFENVAGHISMGLDVVLSALEDEGYAVWPLVVPAAGVGAPHRRDRVWIVACDDRHVVDSHGSIGTRGFQIDSGNGSQTGTVKRRQLERANGGAVVANAACGQGDGRKRSSQAASQTARGCVDAATDVGGQDVANFGRISAQIPAAGKQPTISVAGGASKDRETRPNQRANETVGSVGIADDGVSGWVAGPGRINPWSGDWENGTPRVVSEEVDRVHKLRALGNSIVPQIASAIIAAMIAAEDY